nr:unnamed protein product [Spirometra erinaceieuropaei]
MPALLTRIFYVRFGLAEHLRAQLANHTTTPMSSSTNTAIITPVANFVTTTTPVTSDPPPLSISNTICSTPNPASITATYSSNTTTFCTPPPMGRERMSRYLPSPSIPLPQEMGTWSQRVLTVTAISPHTLAWSATREAVEGRLANQRLKNQHKPGALDSTAHKAY